MPNKLLRAAAAALAVLTICSAPVSAENAVEEAPAEVILNAADLNPTETGIPALDKLVAETLDSLIDKDMDSYEKIRTCYDWLLDNMSYDSSMKHLGVSVGDMTCGDIFYTYGEVNGFGAVALASNYGLCNGYAAGFILMARRLGYDAKLIDGYTLNGGGGYSWHKWAEIKIDGTAYVFDPQLDQNAESWGLEDHSFFCKTYEQVGKRYRRA